MAEMWWQRGVASTLHDAMWGSLTILLSNKQNEYDQMVATVAKLCSSIMIYYTYLQIEIESLLPLLHQTNRDRHTP